MRFLLAGLVVFFPATLAFAQARGHVESIGFGGVFRPGCWTPMVVYLVPTTGSTFTGRIEVVQQDLDGDKVHFTRQITLTGNPAGGGTSEARFWMYFIPQSNNKPPLDGTQTKDELSDIIKVRLCTESGKELIKLPITQTLTPVETLRNETRGRRVVLCVHKDHLPNLLEYQSMIGLTEDVRYVPLREVAFGLPDNVVGYDGIDALVWTDADPTKLSDEQVKALEEFVRRGGRLVISQDTATSQWQRNNLRLISLMPVTVKGIEELNHLRPLWTLEKFRAAYPVLKETGRPYGWSADRLPGPFKYAAANVRPGARVVHPRPYPKASSGSDAPAAEAPATQPAKDDFQTPYLVRMALGAGSVTWVAQDLGDRQLVGQQSSTPGWSYIWDEILDWRNEPRLPQSLSEAQRKIYEANISLETGKGLLKYMDLPSTSAALVGIAVLFFLLYWAAAGPGSYWALLRKGRSHLSWFIFGGVAIAGTFLTVVIVKLVLRGDAQLQHVSYVRMVRNEPAEVVSNIGLYIPRDGVQKVALKETTPGRSSYITAFPLHPAFVETDLEFFGRDYTMPVREITDAAAKEALDPRIVQIPYRSTLKKFQAKWVGPLSGGIDGTPVLERSVPVVRGVLTNNTGRDLRMVYLVFHHPQRDGLLPADVVLYVSRWKSGGQIDLAKEFATIAQGGAPTVDPEKKEDLGLNDLSKVTRLQGEILPDRLGARNNWMELWYKQYRSESGFDRAIEEGDPLSPKAFAILSFYDRIYICKNDARKNRADRLDVLRRGVRNLDLSSAISAGQMGIIGVSEDPESPLPFPIEVEDRRVKGKGVTYYQFVIPVDPTPLMKPTIQPTPGTETPAANPVAPTDAGAKPQSGRGASAAAAVMDVSTTTMGAAISTFSSTIHR